MFQFFQTNYSIFSKLSLIIAMAVSVLEKIMPTFWNRQIVMVYKKKTYRRDNKSFMWIKNVK